MFAQLKGALILLASEVINFVLKTGNFALETRNPALKTSNFALKMMNLRGRELHDGTGPFSMERSCFPIEDL